MKLERSRDIAVTSCNEVCLRSVKHSVPKTNLGTRFSSLRLNYDLTDKLGNKILQSSFKLRSTDKLGNKILLFRNRVFNCTNVPKQSLRNEMMESEIGKKPGYSSNFSLRSLSS